MTHSEQSVCLRPDLTPSAYTYNLGCRCPECRAAMSNLKKASARRTGTERRVGVRAEQKRRWDDAHGNGRRS